MQILRIAGQSATPLFWRYAFGENGDTVPRLLTMPDRGIARFGDIALREALLRRFQFLQTDNVGLGFLEPAQQQRQPAVHAIHVVGRDLHCVGDDQANA